MNSPELFELEGRLGSEAGAIGILFGVLFFLSCLLFSRYASDTTITMSSSNSLSSFVDTMSQSPTAGRE